MAVEIAAIHREHLSYPAAREAYVEDDNRIKLYYHVRAFMKSAPGPDAIDIGGMGVATAKVASHSRRH